MYKNTLQIKENRRSARYPRFSLMAVDGREAGCVYSCSLRGRRNLFASG